MSFAPQNQAPDVSDAIDGSITTWYENINNCLKTSECVPGHYEYTQAPSYGTQCPIQEGGSTKVDLACNRFEIIDINNSYIDAEFEFNVDLPAQVFTDENLCDDCEDGNTYYIGFKSSYDLIDQYRIYSNGDLILTQNHSNYEGFLNYLSLTDSAKENSPCYATIDKVRRHDENVPGIYITTDSHESINHHLSLKLKIPLNAFPMLQNLKYFTGFMGRLQIEIYPSYKNLVWANVSKGYGDIVPEFQKYLKNQRYLGSGAATYLDSTPIELTLRDAGGFVQINCESCNRLYEDTTDGNKIKPYYQTFSCSESTLTKFHLYQAVYMVKMDIYNSLEMNYLQIPLLFPIQTVADVKFTYAMGNSRNFTLQNAATLSHCDTVFVVFANDKGCRTVSYNPEIKAQLSINGKYYPREQLSTAKGDPKFINLIYDALNINNNPFMTPSKDIIDSINLYKYRKIYVNDNEISADRYQINNGDHSNFVFAVPLSTDEDFMGGISSNGSTIQIELIGSRDGLDEAIDNTSYTEPPVAVFLEDKLLKIYSMKPPGKPQIQITNATLEQIVASGGTA